MNTTGKATTSAELLTRQAGAIHQRQAAALLTERQLRGHLDAGTWTRSTVDGQVYLLGGRPECPRQRAWVAYLAFRYGALSNARLRQVAITGKLAAVLLGMKIDDSEDDTEVLLPDHIPYRPRPGVVVRRVADWSQVTFMRLDGLLVTGAKDTLMQLGRTLEPGDLLTVIQDQVFRRKTGLGDLLRRCRRGRNGSAAVREVVRTLMLGMDSVLHERGVRWLRREGLPPDACDVELAPGAGPSDCVINVPNALPPHRGFANEWDGDVHRVDREQFRRDRRKDRKVLTAGYTTLRFTSDSTEAEVRAAARGEWRRLQGLPPAA